MATVAASSTEEIQPKSPAISFINLQKGKPLLIANEYIFKSNKTTTTTNYWKFACNGCSSKIHTDLNGKLTKIIDEHTQSPEKENIEVREFREKF
ncbi:unnamed protein product [Rotaria sp. Silwood2]|nr:unnamed protein product [Rotaria sp. Silwood2]CAF3132945.1 unnamed protein product [Rotaria sp. Silwood2]CAF3436091.1 unnamed protein product [Rotaria sp. Silwood2]CAF4321853.1 unnamed protein product [Rotaria sp. Silwood2]CAF4490516.1 unnamed protein product [Rotaria sp. Silwood2]